MKWSFGMEDMFELVAINDYPLAFLGSSPSFFTNWTWYKDMPKQQQLSIQTAQRQWNALSIYTIDIRLPKTCSTLDPFPLEFVDAVRILTQHISSNASSIYRSNHSERIDIIHNTIYRLESLLELLRTYDRLSITCTSIRCAIDELQRLANNQPHTSYQSSFKEWWGNGQQYLSLFRYK